MLKNLTDRLLDNVERAIIQEARTRIEPHADKLIQNAVSSTFDFLSTSHPKARATGGSTQTYLKQITTDFEDFHAEDADTDIQTFLIEYLAIQYNKLEKFDKSKVSDRVAFNINKSDLEINDLQFHQMSICDYQKSLNSATIKYRASVGFQEGRSKKEKLYEIEYTLQLRDLYGSKSFLRCSVCGAPLNETDAKCSFCGTKHLRDTISSWVVTDIKEK